MGSRRSSPTPTTTASPCSRSAGARWKGRSGLATSPTAWRGCAERRFDRGRIRRAPGASADVLGPVGHRAHAPQLAAALLDAQGRQPPAGARAARALSAVRPVARSVMAAHQGVVVVVEEVGVAEVELERFVAAGVEVGVHDAPIADGEGCPLDPVDHDREAEALSFAEAPGFGHDANRLEVAHLARAAVAVRQSAPMSDPTEAGTRERPRIAVYGSSSAREHEDSYRLALALGAALARGGADVMTGGFSGVMEAASRGAAEAGGHVIGVTVSLFEARGPANRWVKERIHAPDLFDRLRHLIATADAHVVVEGSVGTLTELFLTWTLAGAGLVREGALVLAGSNWPAYLEAHRDVIPLELFRLVKTAATAEEAASLALAAANVGFPRTQGTP